MSTNIVTCETVRKAFGDFQCCEGCHLFVDRLCCEAAEVLSRNDAVFDPEDGPTHPALLKALENHEE